MIKSEFWTEANITPLQQRTDTLNTLAASAFGIPLETGFDISTRYDDWDLVYGVEYDGKTVGFGAYMLYDSPNGTILYEDIKTVYPDFQGLGIGRRITKQVIEDVLRATNGPLHLLARTQNGFEVKSLQDALQNLRIEAPIIPLQRLPNAEDQITLASYLEKHPPHHGYVDLGTFINHGAYAIDMTANFSQPTIDTVGDYLTHNNSSRAQGDAIFVLIPHIRS